VSLVEELERLGERDTDALAALAPYRAALLLGRLHVCCNCSTFVFDSNGILGHCRRFNLEAAPFLPFWCSGFEVSRTPAAPGYLPDPDGARARSKEYTKSAMD
jgi:hypothetical protein